MKIMIKSRSDIEEAIFAPKTALISITDEGWSFPKLKSKPEYMLQIAFDDVDNDVFIDELNRKPTEAEKIQIESKYHMLSDEQARSIVKFYMSIIDKVDVLICQCEHGQSRSAAIAAAILEFRSRSGIKVFADDRYHPNKAVFNKVLEQFKNI